MKARELIPWLVAAQALTILILCVLVSVFLSWKRELVRLSRSRTSEDTVPIRKVS